MGLVTGATGLVGSFICQALLAKGHQVRATKREQSSFDLVEEIKEEIEWVDAELGDAIFWEHLLEGVEAVVHAAATISFDKKWEHRMYETNVKGTADLINAVLRSEVKDFLHVSSVAAIGRRPDKERLNEKDRWEGNSFDSIYARSKYYQELEVWRGAEEGLHVKIINPSIVLGPGTWTNSGSTSVFKYVYEQRSFCPQGSVNYVDVRDVADISVQLLESDIKNERFILNAGSTDYKHFFGTIAKKFGKKGPQKIPQPWMLKIAVFLEWLRARLSGTQTLITKETALISMNHFHFDNDKVSSTLDFEFRSLEDTVSWVTEELKKAHSL